MHAITGVEYIFHYSCSAYSLASILPLRFPFYSFGIHTKIRSIHGFVLFSLLLLLKVLIKQLLRANDRIFFHYIYIGYFFHNVVVYKLLLLSVMCYCIKI